MAALAKDRNTPARDGVRINAPVAAATIIYAGALVALNAAGDAVPAAAALGLRAVGRAEARVDNSAGAAGDLSVELGRGVFRFANSAAGDAIARADIGTYVYLVDDQTVAKTSGNGARSIAGRVLDVDAQGVWVEVGRPGNLAAVASLDFPSVAAGASQELTIAVPGARVNDAVALGLPAAPLTGLAFDAYVSADDTVTVRASNVTAGAIDPAAANYRVTVIPS